MVVVARLCKAGGRAGGGSSGGLSGRLQALSHSHGSVRARRGSHLDPGASRKGRKLGKQQLSGDLFAPLRLTLLELPIPRNVGPTPDWRRQEDRGRGAAGWFSSCCGACKGPLRLRVDN